MKHVLSLRFRTWFLAVIVCVILSLGESLHPHRSIYREQIPHGDHQILKHPKEGGNVELFQSGSGIPDCSHACGPCFPCKRVMISYKCGMATESCPVIYRCFCRGRYYHVPSN